METFHDKSRCYHIKYKNFQKIAKKCLTSGVDLGITTNALRHSGSEKAPRGREERVLKTPSEKTLKKVVDRKKQMMHKASSPLMSGGGSLTSE